LKEGGNPFLANIYDPNGQLSINFGVYGTPETFIIDAKGIIRYKYIGPITERVWQATLLPKIKKLAVLRTAKKRKLQQVSPI